MSESIRTRYTGIVDLSGGRNSHAISSDQALDVQLRLPKLRGDNDGTNPEQLFAAAWGGCVLAILGAITRKDGPDVSGARVHVEVDVGTDLVNGEEALAARIDLAIPDLELTEVQDLANQVHAICPYSKATRGNIPVEINAVEYRA